MYRIRTCRSMQINKKVEIICQRVINNNGYILIYNNSYSLKTTERKKPVVLRVGVAAAAAAVL